MAENGSAAASASAASCSADEPADSPGAPVNATVRLEDPVEKLVQAYTGLSAGQRRQAYERIAKIYAPHGQSHGHNHVAQPHGVCGPHGHKLEHHKTRTLDRDSRSEHEVDDIKIAVPKSTSRIVLETCALILSNFILAFVSAPIFSALEHDREVEGLQRQALLVERLQLSLNVTDYANAVSVFGIDQAQTSAILAAVPASSAPDALPYVDGVPSDLLNWNWYGAVCFCFTGAPGRRSLLPARG